MEVEMVGCVMEVVRCVMEVVRVCDGGGEGMW